jgi:hypothetical protein
MKRKELLKSREYWIANIQLKLFEVIEDHLRRNNMNRTQFAEEIGVSKGYVSQVLNGEFDHKISKMVDLCLAVGAVPVFDFKDINDFIGDELCKVNVGVGQYSSQPFKMPLLDTPVVIHNLEMPVNYTSESYQNPTKMICCI